MQNKLLKIKNKTNKIQNSVICNAKNKNAQNRI